MLAIFVLALLSALLMGSSYGQSVYSSSIVSSGGIVVQQFNGVLHIVIDGVRLKMDRAQIVKENNELQVAISVPYDLTARGSLDGQKTLYRSTVYYLQVLRPYEKPEALVTVYKHQNRIKIEYKDSLVTTTGYGMVRPSGSEEQSSSGTLHARSSPFSNPTLLIFIAFVVKFLPYLSDR